MLRTEVVIDDCPGSDRPTIVNLPHESTSTVLLARTLPLPLPESIGGGETFSLHQLSRVDELLQWIGCVAEVFYEIQCNTTLVTISLVVEIDGGGLREAVG